LKIDIFSKIFSGNQPRQLVLERNRRFGNHLRPSHRTFEATCHIRTLMMGTEMVPETSVSFYNQLTPLIAREYFIEFSRHEKFKSYN
jgi:hypothetical protein